MKLERSHNVNTESYWDGRYEQIVSTAPPIASTDNFFRFGFIPKDERVSVLEIGCGTATHYPEIVTRYPKVQLFGADISKFAYLHNKHTYSPIADFQHLDIETQEIQGSYDYIISAHTFEHLTDPVAAVEKCRKAARKGVIICVPYKESWSYDHEHMHTFSEDEPLTGFDYYLVEFDKKHNVGAIYFRFST